MSLSVVVLTYNEEKHLRRCLDSCKQISSQIFVVDSFSTDKTRDIAIEFGAQFYQNPFVNQAVQFQWALDNIKITTDWVLKLDADEYLLPDLAEEIKLKLPLTPDRVSGYIMKRRVYFMDRWIKYGGYYPTKLLRLWRTGLGSVEQRCWDEHIIVKEGQLIELNNDFVDYNLNNLTWWTAKHNNYSTREAIDLLNKEYKFLAVDSFLGKINSDQQNERKRFLKNQIYAKVPPFFRAFIYFNYRYWWKLGFLDGKQGFIWHVLQGFWYRFLVDAKIQQIKFIAERDKRSVYEVLKTDFQAKI